MGLYKVTTLVQFKHVYFVEGDKLSHALDEVTMRESGNDADYFEEAAQEYLGETIFDSEAVSRADFEKFLTTAKEADLSSSHWLGEDLIRKIKYDTPTNKQVAINVHNDEENMGFEGTVTVSFGGNDISREVFKQMGTSLFLGQPDIGPAGTREASRYDRWSRFRRGY